MSKQVQMDDYEMFLELNNAQYFTEELIKNVVPLMETLKQESHLDQQIKTTQKDIEKYTSSLKKTNASIEKKKEILFQNGRVIGRFHDPREQLKKYKESSSNDWDVIVFLMITI